MFLKTTNIDNLNDVISEFHDTNGEFDHFFKTNDKQCERYKNITKHLYDHLQKKHSLFDSKIQQKLQKAEMMKSLIIKDFDNEQIWQQLEMLNQPFLKNIVADVASFTNKKAFVTFNLDLGEKKQTKSEVDENKSKRNAKFAFDDESDMEELNDDLISNHKNEIVKKIPHKKQQKRNNQKVDFFNLKEMETFLDAEDEKEMNDKDDKEPNDGEDDVQVDYFADIPSDDGENENEDMMYDDFFDPPPKKGAKKVTFGEDNEDLDDNDVDDEEDEDEEIEGLDTRDYDENEDKILDDEETEDEEEDDEDSSKLDARDMFANSSSEEEEDEINKKLRNLASQNYNDDSEDDLEGKSEFEKSQILLKKKIEKAQRELLQPAALNWKLAGEAISDARPENSLLEEHLDFDHISRPAPVITDDTTKTLEDLIKQRIKDKVFDDVERKTKPKEEPFEFRRRLMVESEKSKVGLAEVYEKEFMKKQEENKQQQTFGFVADGEIEESENRKEIRRMMKSLFRKLDALSTFHFTPRPPEVEVKIINNMPAITVEEATPDMASGKSLIAPEEVYNTRNKKVLQAPGERDSTDRKRARRIKKKKQSIKQRIIEKKHGNNAALINKAEIDKLKKKSSSNGLKKTFTSSTKFFDRLQETKELSQNIKRKQKSIENNLAKKLKLN